MVAEGRYYQDIVIGEVRESSARKVTREELLEFAIRYDPQYFHANPAAAAGSIFGEIIASGIHGAALWRRLDHEISGDIRWICGIAWEDVRWPNPIRRGTNSGRDRRYSANGRAARIPPAAWWNAAIRF